MIKDSLLILARLFLLALAVMSFISTGAEWQEAGEHWSRQAVFNGVVGALLLGCYLAWVKGGRNGDVR